MGVFKNFDAISFLRGYCYSVIPLVYTDSLSYMEILCQVRKKVNELIENNNKLPQLITEVVEKFLESEEFESLIKSIISGGVLNVKFPPEGLDPMKGDGVTNDTEAFQGIIKYASDHDKCIFVPCGSYLLDNIVVPTGLGIYGECRGAVKFYQVGGQTGVFFTLTGENGLRNITLDCVKFNKTAVVHALSATYSSVIDCAVVDGYTGALIANGCFVQNLHCIDNNEDVIISGSKNVVSCDGVVHDNGVENTWIDSVTVNLGSNDVVLNPVEPLTYRTPELLNDYFNSVNFKSGNGDIYKVLVEGEKLHELSASGVTNVKDFGAVGDGVTDDYNAINNALNYAKENNTVLYLPSGSYLITNSIFGYSGMTLIGDGLYKTEILMSPDINKSCVDFDNNISTFFQNIEVREITFNQNHAGGGDIGAHAFRICGFSGLYIHNCRFINASGYGLGLQAHENNTNPLRRGVQQFLFVRGCHFLNNGNNEADKGDGFDCKSLTYGIISDCYFYNNKNHGLDIRGQGVLISNILARNNSTNGVNLRTPFTGCVSNVDTLNNLTAGVGVESNIAYQENQSLQSFTLEGLKSSGDAYGIYLINKDTTLNFVKQIQMSNITIINPTSAAVSFNGYNTDQVSLTNLTARGRKSGTGIFNASKNIRILNALIDNRFEIGYDGDNQDDGSIISLFANKATTPTVNTNATFLYPLQA